MFSCFEVDESQFLTYLLLYYIMLQRHGRTLIFILIFFLIVL
jgi:hypothetical protein